MENKIKFFRERFLHSHQSIQTRMNNLERLDRVIAELNFKEFKEK